MDKKKMAAVAAAINFLQIEKEEKALKFMKKNAYKKFSQKNSVDWQSHGIKNIMSGRKSNIKNR